MLSRPFWLTLGKQPFHGLLRNDRREMKILFFKTHISQTDDQNAMFRAMFFCIKKHPLFGSVDNRLKLCYNNFTKSKKKYSSVTYV